MKAYQVYYGEQDKHSRQQWTLVGTYLNKEKAFEHCETITANEKLYDGDTIEFAGWSQDGRHAYWNLRSWEYVGLCKFSEIDIIT